MNEQQRTSLKRHLETVVEILQVAIAGAEEPDNDDATLTEAIRDARAALVAIDEMVPMLESIAKIKESWGLK